MATREVQHGRQVGVHPEQFVEVADRLGHVQRFAQHRHGSVRIRAPTERNPEGRGGMEFPGNGRRAARPRHPDGVTGEAFRVRECALEHAQLSQAREDGSARRRWRGRDEIDGSSSCRERPFGVAGHPSELSEAVMDESEAGPITAGVGGADGSLEVGGGADRAAGGERRFSGAHAEIAGGGHGLCVTLAGAGGSVRPTGAPGAIAGRAECRDRELQRDQLIGRRMHGRRRISRSDRCSARGQWIERQAMVMHRHEWVLGKGDRDRRMVTDQGGRQQVRLDRPAHKLVAQVQTICSIDDKAVLDGLVKTGHHIGVQHPVPLARSAR